MEPTWAFALVVLYPALQVPLLWLVVERFDLRNDDGPDGPTTYSVHPAAAAAEREPARCRRCGTRNDEVAAVCRNCLAGLRGERPQGAD